MVDPELYISEGLKIIKRLVHDGHLVSALNACQELLKVNPYHRTVQSMLSSIEEKIIEKNEQKVDMDIDATMHLWDEKRYEDLLKIYSRLYQFAPTHRRLRRLMEKAQECLTQEQKEQRSRFIRQALSAIGGLMNEKKFGDVIQACNELLNIDGLNDEAKQYLKKAKYHLIEQKLKENQRIVEGSDFERALELYMTLLGIDADNKEVKRLALMAKAHLAEQKLIAEKIHLNESVARMKELFKNAEYEHVLQSCEEIKRLDPGNFTARIFKKKALAAIDREIDEQTVTQLKAAWTQLTPEFQKNPDGFVKL